MEETLYDLAIIGSGPGGYHAALRATIYGAKVALIEKADRLGGTCSNLGCIPTKALYSSAQLISDIREKADDFGVHIEGMKVDFGKAVERKNKVVKELTDGIRLLCNARKVEVFQGFGYLIGGSIPETFKVGIRAGNGEEQTIQAKRVIIATGSKPAAIPAFNIDHKKILDSDDILNPNYKKLPKSMIIIGGGVIGCEFANIFVQYGCKITILEYLPNILNTEEKLVINTIKKELKKLGIKIHTSKNVLSVEATENGVKATICDAKIPRDKVDCPDRHVIEADQCLVSIGRSKVIQNMGLEDLGIKIVRGSIFVNHNTMETSCPGIYAIGDCTGIIMLAHFASYQGDVAVSNTLVNIGFRNVKLTQTDYSVVPSTIFTHPNIGSVGIRQSEAKKTHDILVGRFAYASSGKARCMGETIGFLMVIADKHTDKILGASCIGVEAPELIAEIAVMMRNGQTTHHLIRTIHSHPTLSEIVLEAVEDVHGMAIHKAKRIR